MHINPNPTRSSSPAFTLIELLVVISIIALLIGILLPALGAARDSARDVKCLSNVRQIDIASQAYATDSKGLFPHYSDNVNRGGSKFGNAQATYFWTSNLVVLDYGAAREMYRCPRFEESTVAANTIFHADLNDRADGNWRFPDYGINWGTLAAQIDLPHSAIPAPTDLYGSSTNLGRVRKPSDTLAFADSITGRNNSSIENRGIMVIRGVGSTQEGVDPRHTNGAVNIGWADGHASAVYVKGITQSLPYGDVYDKEKLGTHLTDPNKWDLD